MGGKATKVACLLPRHGAKLSRELQPLQRWSLDGIAQAYMRFQTMERFVPAITESELHTVLGLDDKKAASQIFRLLAKGPEESQKVNLQQLLGLMIIVSKAPINQKVKFAFVLFDSNKSGDLSKNELVAMLTNVLTGLFIATDQKALTNEDIEQISNVAFKEADAINDGRITYAEFSCWMRTSNVAKEAMRGYPPNYSAPKSSNTEESDTSINSLSETSTSIRPDHENKERKSSAHNSSSYKTSEGALRTSKQRRKETRYRKKKHADQLDHIVALEESATKIQTIFRGNAVRNTFDPEPSRDEKRETHSRPATIAQQTNLVSRYHKKAVLQVRKQFREMDMDSSGGIDTAEFAKHFTSTTADKSDTSTSRTMFGAIDTNRNGTITLFEMVRVVFPNASKSDYRMMDSWIQEEDENDKRKRERRNKKLNKVQIISSQQLAELAEVFKVYDEDGDGTLSGVELESALHRTGVFSIQEIQQLFREADITGDGQISLEEFQECFKEHMIESLGE